MKNGEKIWAVLVHLTMHMWNDQYETLPFEDEMWEYILEESVKTGVNMIVLDVGDGIEYVSHPEISMKGAWSQERVRAELKRCRELGITLIPKLNFATPHDRWLGEYSRMVSTRIYYQVAKDLIEEVWELFDHPQYIHLGFDEEDADHVAHMDFALYRQGALFWHDLRYLLDCVHATGAKPWIWSCPLFFHPEEFKKHIGAKEAIISPWYYDALRPEHYTPISSKPIYVEYYSQLRYRELNMQYVEDDPFLTTFRKVALPLMEEGYDYVPCTSVTKGCDCNADELLEYFKENAPDGQILGYITAPWISTQRLPVSQMRYEKSFRFLKAAKEKYYG